MLPIFLVLVRPAWGPLGRDVNSVVTVAKILLDGKTINEIDPLMTPLPFNEQVLLTVHELKSFMWKVI